MEIVEFKELFGMDTGSPSPIILSDGGNLFVAFYGDEWDPSRIPSTGGDDYYPGILVIKFIRYQKYTFGLPNDESLSGHPYYKLGMEQYGFYELKDSDLIASLIKIQSVHPKHKPEKWIGVKHFIITFHDNMLECIAREFEIKQVAPSIYDDMNTMLNDFKKQFEQ
jgi:hypothetical protein